MALKWLFFSEKNKIGRIFQRLEASPIWMTRCLTWALPPGPHSGNLFSFTQSSQPKTFKIVIIGCLNKKMV